MSSGYCLCGAVQISAALVNHEATVCHCAMCPRWRGAPFISVAWTPVTAFASNDAMTIHPSSAWVERGFCKYHGSPLSYRLKSDGPCNLPVEPFDDTAGLMLVNEIFIDRKPPFYSFAEKTKKMTATEAMVMFGTPAGES